MLDLFTATDNYLGMVIIGAVAIALCFPLVGVVRSEKKLTWTGSIVLGTWLTTIALLLIADVPSRMLYWFDANHNGVAERIPVLAPIMGPDKMQFLGMQVDRYLIARDIVVNSVQGLIFVVIVALTYFWGERHRKAGRFGK